MLIRLTLLACTLLLALGASDARAQDSFEGPYEAYSFRKLKSHYDSRFFLVRDPNYLDASFVEIRPAIRELLISLSQHHDDRAFSVSKHVLKKSMVNSDVRNSLRLLGDFTQHELASLIHPQRDGQIGLLDLHEANVLYVTSNRAVMWTIVLWWDHQRKGWVLDGRLNPSGTLSRGTQIVFRR
jgi:hypothetical protein